MISPDEKRLYTIPDAAEALGIGRTTVYELLSANELERVKVGSRALVTATSIDAYVARLVAAAQEKSDGEASAA